MQAQTAFDRRSGVQIVDVRDPKEWDAGHIEGSRHIPVDELAGRAAELPSDVPIVAVCRTGRRSGRAVEMLRSLGFEADHVEGGLVAWLERALPLVAPGGGPGTLAAAGARDDHEHEHEHEHDHDHDHDHDHRGGGELGPGIQQRVMELMAAAQEHFGDREPSEQVARDFFQQLLAAEGRTQEEIDEILS